MDGSSVLWRVCYFYHCAVLIAEVLIFFFFFFCLHGHLAHLSALRFPYSLLIHSCGCGRCTVEKQEGCDEGSTGMPSAQGLMEMET